MSYWWETKSLLPPFALILDKLLRNNNSWCNIMNQRQVLAARKALNWLIDFWLFCFRETVSNGCCSFSVGANNSTRFLKLKFMINARKILNQSGLFGKEVLFGPRGEVLADPNPNTVRVHHYFEKIILLATNSVVCAFERNATLIAVSSLQLVWEFSHL